MAKVKVRLNQARQFERAIGAVTREYLIDMVARAIVLVDSHKNRGALVEAIDFPSFDQVQRRWNRVKNRINVKDAHRWAPTEPPDFDYYRKRIVDREAEKKFVEDVIGLKYAAYQSAAAGAAADLGRRLWVSDEVLKSIREKTFKIVTTNITPTMRDELIAKIEASISAGFTVEETAHNLGMLNTNWRTVAKTETFDVLNAGAWDQIHQEAQETDAEIVKYWQHSGNSRNPRDAHIKAGEDYGPENAIPVDQPFIVNGVAMMRPHDPDAPPEEVINCGCTCVYLTRTAQGLMVPTD